MWMKLRNLTFGEWVNLIAASGAMLSAVFALLAVLAAKEQVQAAFGVVNRTEMIKSLSEYSKSLHAICLASIPPELVSDLRVHQVTYESLRSAPIIEYSIKEPAISNNDLVAAIKGHRPPYHRLINKSVESAKELMLWIEAGEHYFPLFAYPTMILSDFTARNELNISEALQRISAEYTACEQNVGIHIAKFLKR